jgi:hypothetical protein
MKAFIHRKKKKIKDIYVLAPAVRASIYMIYNYAGGRHVAISGSGGVRACLNY